MYSLLLACRCKILMRLPWRTESLRLPQQVVLYDWLWKWIFGRSVLVLNLIMCLQMTCFYKYLWKGFLEIESNLSSPNALCSLSTSTNPLFHRQWLLWGAQTAAQPYTAFVYSFLPRFLEIIFICFTQK